MTALLTVLWRFVCRLFGWPRWRRVARVKLIHFQASCPPILLRAELPIWLETADGGLVRRIVVVDSGAPVSIFGLTDAEAIQLPVPPPESEFVETFRLGDGQSHPFRMRPGEVRVRFSDDVTAPPLIWPVRFHVHSPSGSMPLLGLGGVLERSDLIHDAAQDIYYFSDSLHICRWIFDGRTTPDAPFGVFLFDVLDR
jgi:hypothetical protein